MTRSLRKASLPMLAALFLSAFPRQSAAASSTGCSETGNFNGTPIAAGNVVWFNGVFSVPGFDPSRLTKPLTLSFTGVTIQFSTYTVAAPNALITYDPTATTATTTFDVVNNQWVTTLPTTHLAGNDFLDAVAFTVPAGGLPGGIHSVTWQGTFASSMSGMTVQWQWAAAVYTAFSTDYNAVGVKPTDDNKGSAYKNSDHAGTPEAFAADVVGGATGGGGSNFTGSYSGTAACSPGTAKPPTNNSCQAMSALSALVSGKNVTSYIPKGSWERSVTGVSVVNVEGTSVTPTLIATPNAANSCASNSVTGQTVCTANNTDVYLIGGTTLTSTLTSSGNGPQEFSGGLCTNCGVMMDVIHNKAVISLATSPGFGGFQFLDLAPSTPTFEPAFASPAPGGPFYPGNTSENPLIDPVNNLLLSASESSNFEIIGVANTASPTFFEHPIPNPDFTLVADSSTEDCTTGIAVAPYEFATTSQVYLADLTQATFSPGSPGAWTVPAGAEQIQTLSESDLTSGFLGTGGGSTIAPGTHTGALTGEFGGHAITAVALPSTSGSGTPAFSDWVTCGISPTFLNGEDPHAVTSYQSPNSGHAIALVAGNNAGTLAVIDLTMMLDPTIVPRTAAGHGCASGMLPPTVVTFIVVP